MDFFGLHLQQEMPCSTEQCTHAQVSDVSSEAEIERDASFFSPSPFNGRFQMRGQRKWTSETLALIFMLLFLACTEKHSLRRRWRGSYLHRGGFHSPGTRHRKNTGIFRNILPLPLKSASDISPGHRCSLSSRHIPGDSIFSFGDTFSQGGTLVSISFEARGDQGGLSTAASHTL